MSQLVEDESGQVHEFPDEATPEQMQSAISGSDLNKPGIMELLKNASQNFLSSADNTQLFPNMISGFASHFGKTPEQKELIRNIPQGLTNRHANIGERLSQGIGEYAPVALSGVGAIRGLPGILYRVGASSGYGASQNPDDPLGGAQMGAAVGLGGEAAPAAFHAIGKYAEKLNPIKFAKQKISEIHESFKNTEKRQKEAYSHYEPYSKELVSVNPKNLFDEKEIEYFTPKVYKKYLDFVKEPTLGKAHKLQSQMFTTGNTIKFAGAEDIGTREAMEISRERLNNLIKEKLKMKDPYAAAKYQEGTDITRDELKPYLETRKLKQLAKGKIKEMQPIALQKALNSAFEKESSKISTEHTLSKILNELNPRLESGSLVKDLIPDQLRKWSPKFVKLAQRPDLIEALKQAEGVYKPIRTGLSGMILEK